MQMSLRELELLAMIARSLGIKLSERAEWTGNAILAAWMIRYKEPGCDIDAEDYLRPIPLLRPATGLALVV